MSGLPYSRVYLYKRLVQAKLFIDEHYGSQMDLDNIADEAAFSKFHFIRLFKKTYGLTPHQYLTSVRLDKARALLAEGRPVSEICYSVGFDSLSSFTGLFKRATGITPTGYREQYMLRFRAIQAVPLSVVPDCFAEIHGWKKATSEKCD